MGLGGACSRTLGSRTHLDDPAASAPESNLFPSETTEWSVLEGGLAFWGWSQEGDVGGAQQHSREEKPRKGREERRLGTELTPFRRGHFPFKNSKRKIWCWTKSLQSGEEKNPSQMGPENTVQV